MGARKREMSSWRTFIGDVHGKFGRYKEILKSSVYPTIQVGDMGVGFLKFPHGEKTANPPYDLMVEKDALFIRGNHDNPEFCLQHPRCIKDGTVIDNMMFCGGAVSIDKAYRHEGFSWWEDEELSESDLVNVEQTYAVAKPEIMVSHECPEKIAALLVGRLNNLATPGQKWKLDPRWDSRTRHAFDRMHSVHQPQLWIFGHWHVRFDDIVDGTRFICLPELATIDIDTKTLRTSDEGHTYS